MSGGGRAHCGHPVALEVHRVASTPTKAMFNRFHASTQKVQISNLRLHIAFILNS